MSKQARKIKAHRGRISIIGRFASVRMKELIQWESLIERDYIYLLEIDHDVSLYRSQPFQISYAWGGKLHTYTPDFLVERRSGERGIVEIKPKDELPEYEKLFEAIRCACEEQGMTFSVVTDEMIRVHPVLDNAKLLCRYASVIPTPYQLTELLTMSRAAGPSTIEELGHMVSQAKLPKSLIFSLMFYGYFGFDNHRPINKQATIWVAKEVA